MQTIDYVTVGDCLRQLETLKQGRRTILVTDTNVKELYPTIFESCEHIVMESGERAKNINTYQDICRDLLDMGVDRGVLLVGVGGGVVTDMTGFVGATYMRGVSFGFVATTLLAQIDASLGGKNGVDFEGYKNIVGTFVHPEFVLCDPLFLKTLPQKELRAGYGELVKYAMLAGEDILASSDYIARCVEIKMDVVRNDFKEGGRRKLLNLGHTFAHAIEKCTDEYNHGEAVGIGLCVAAEISQKLGFLSVEECKKTIKMVEKYDLPTQIPSSIAVEELLDAVLRDKKRDKSSIDMILLRNIGAPIIHPISFELLFEAFKG